MAAGIVQVAAQAGYFVFMKLHKNKERGLKLIDQGLTRLVKKDKITTSGKAEILSRIRPTSNWEDARDVDFVIESVSENFDVKKEVFGKLDSICRPDVIFSTNTSSIPISKLATTIRRPGKFVGLHFFNPVPAMRIAEVVRGAETSFDTVVTTEKLAHSMMKETVRVKDVPGFLVNRMNQAFRNEAYHCLNEGVANIEDIDKAAKLALGLPLGPFEVADMVGLDVGLEVLRVLYDGYGDPKWKPDIFLERLVEKGDLGRKTGKGWYDYSSGDKKSRNDIKEILTEGFDRKP